MEYGLIGKTLVHSYSKIIHEYIAPITYELHSLQEDEIASFFAKKEFKGINVTIPYKKTVIPYLNELDEVASSIGAVNVITKKDGYLKGYNTDAFGFEKMLKHYQINVRHKKVLILGTGGTSSTVSYVLKKMGAKEYYFVSRNKVKNSITYEEAEKMFDVEVIINTTPLGMYPHEDDKLLINLNCFPYLESVIDVIYNPFRTKLLIEAKKKGCKVCSGLYMLVAQAVRALELFLDTEYEEKIYAGTYLYLLLKSANIVFIGMPSCGKSTASKNLSEYLKVEKFDSDEEVEKDTSKTIKEIFAENGEAYFRKLEAAKIEELSKKKGVVIATGGGAIMNEASAENLMRNGYLIFLNRSLDQMKEKKAQNQDTRPLLKDDNSLDRIFATRYPFYKKYADLIIVNNGSKQKTLETIIDNLWSNI